MGRKIVGVTVGTTMNPKRINEQAEVSWNDLKDKPTMEELAKAVIAELPIYDGEVETV